MKAGCHRSNQIIEFLPDATFAIDTEGTVIAWNRAMEKLTGVGLAGMLWKGDYEYAALFHGRKQPVMIDLALRYDERAASPFQPIERDGDRLKAEISLPDFRGRGPVWLGIAAAPIYGDDGLLLGAIESIRDITALKKAEIAACS